MATAGSIVIDLLMRTGSFETDTKRAEARLKAMEKTVDRWSRRTVLGAASAGAAFAAWTVTMAKSMDSTLKMAQQIGTTTEALTGLRYAAQQFANVSDQTFDMSLRRMTRRIAEAADGSGAAKSALESLGLSARELAGLSVDEQFLRISDAMSKVDGQGAKLRNTMAIFDTEGVPLVNALAQGRGEIEKYIAEAERFGVVVSSEAAQAAAQFQTNLDRLNSMAKGLSISFGNKVLPVLSDFIEYASDAAAETDGILTSASRLANDNALPEWMNIAGRGLAILADVAVGLAKSVGVVGMAFRAAAADSEVALRALQKAQAWNWFSDEASRDLQDSLQRRNDTVASFNNALSDLINYQGDANMQAWDKAWENAQFRADFVGPPKPGGTLDPIRVDPSGGGSGKKGKLDEGAQYLKQLQERIALLGKETEHEQLLARIASGSLTFRTEKQREVAEQLAKQLDATQKQIEMEEVLRDLREQQNTTQMQFFRELESFGQGDRVRQLNADLAKVEDRYRGIIDARRNSPLGLSDEELAQIRESLQIELDMVRDFHEQKLAIQQNWSLGAIDALKNYADEAANVYDSVGRLATTAFKGMEDSLVNFVRTGKLEFSDFANSIISDMIRIMVQQSITGPLAMAFSGWLGGASAPAGVTPGLDWTFSSGGYTGDGGKYEPAGIVHRGEGVLNQEEIRALGGEGGFNALRRAIRTGHAAGGMAGRPALPPSVSPLSPSVSVNVINNSSQPVTASQPKVSMDAMGRMVVDVMIEDLRRNGPYARQLKGNM